MLIWDSWPNENFAPADVVLGQGDFTHNTSNDADQDGSSDATPSGAVLDWPTGVFGYEDMLFVTDCENNRILVFRSN